MPHVDDGTADGAEGNRAGGRLEVQLSEAGGSNTSRLTSTMGPPMGPRGHGPGARLEVRLSEAGGSTV